MKKILLLLFLISACVANPTVTHATNYYVATTGSNANTGLDVANPWATKTYAGSTDSPVQPGDVIYVKAGNYGAEQTLWQKSGTLRKPIRVKGYKTTPNDQPPLVVNASDPYATLVSTDMPTYTGTSAPGSYGIYAPSIQYVIFENLQFTNFYYGISTGFESATISDYDTHITIFNCAAKNMGASDNTNAAFNGYGFILGGMGTDFANNCKIIKCLAVNIQAEAIDVNGNNNQVIDCKVYCNDVNRTTDYYLMITGDYNLVSGCYIERLSSITGNSHGIGAKTNAEQVIDDGDALPTVGSSHNTFINCTAVNLAEGFYVRHRGATYNRFINCKGYGAVGNCVTIRDGAKFNTFENCSSDGCSSAIRIFDSVEDGDTGGSPPGHPNGTNWIINGVFINNATGIYFDNFAVASDAGDIRVYNCTFKNNKYMFSAGRTANGCTYKNLNIYGTLPSTPGGDFKVGGSYANTIIGSQFTNCNFYNIENGMPSGFVASSTSGTTVNPLFISSTDLRLQSGSTIKDSGVTIPEVKKDYNGQTRTAGSYSRGAYER